MDSTTKQEVLGFKAPRKDCTDAKCPFHGSLAVKGELFTGKVVKKDVNHSATIVWSHLYHIPKYERYEMRRARLRVHNPSCIDAQVGDEVIAARTRPISKTKHHVIISVNTHSTGVSASKTVESTNKQKRSTTA